MNFLFQCRSEACTCIEYTICMVFFAYALFPSWGSVAMIPLFHFCLSWAPCSLRPSSPILSSAARPLLFFPFIGSPHAWRTTSSSFFLSRYLYHLSLLRSTIVTTLHSQKRASCNKSVDILQQLVTTRRCQDAFVWLATTCHNKSVASCQPTCCKLIILTND